MRKSLRPRCLRCGDVRLQLRCPGGPPSPLRLLSRALFSGRRGASPPSLQARTSATRRNGPVARRSSTTPGRASERSRGRAGPHPDAESGQAEEGPHRVGERRGHGASAARPGLAVGRDDAGALAHDGGAEVQPEEEHDHLEARRSDPPHRAWSSASGGRPGCPGRRTRPAPTPPPRRRRTPRPARGGRRPVPASSGRARRGQRATARTTTATMGTAVTMLAERVKAVVLAANRA